MKLILKINLIVAAVFVVAAGVAAYAANALLLRNARDEIVHNALIMMESAHAVRTYTETQIQPLLQTQIKYQFLPQSVPAFSANALFDDLRKQHPEYSYKEATLNPTNPRNRTVDWESDIVNRFRDAPTLTEVVGERDNQHGRSLYMARPLQVSSPACLVCHSTVSAAPKTMIDRYGDANGFGWQMNEVVGAQIVSVPMDVPIKRARDTFKVFLALLLGLFVFQFLLLYVLLHTLVVRPVREMAEIADKVSLGDMDAPEFNRAGKDELATLAASFDRMRKSLVRTLKMLGG
jgi:HAMP domain-containing protein